MDYKKLSPKELANKYINSGNFIKKRILKSGIDLNALLIELSEFQIIELANLHPYKELLCDTLLDNLRNYKNPIKADRSSLISYEGVETVIENIDKTKKVGFFGRIMDSIRGRDTKLIEGTINKKIEQLRKETKLMNASIRMCEGAWKGDIVNSKGEFNENVITKTNKDVQEIIEKRSKESYSKSVDKYGTATLETLQEFYSEVYSNYTDSTKRKAAEILGVFELSSARNSKQGRLADTYFVNVPGYDSEYQIESVTQVNNFEIKGVNLGEVFFVQKSDKKYPGRSVDVEICRRDKETGLVEIIGHKNREGNCYMDINNNGEREMHGMASEASKVSYDEVATVTANEIHSKMVVEQVKEAINKQIGKLSETTNKNIEEITEVELPNAEQPMYLIKEIDENNSPTYKMVILDEQNLDNQQPKVINAKEEMFKSIELPTVHSNGDETKRDTAKVVATVNINGEDLQIYTDKHGMARVAEIVDDRKKAYSVLTRAIYKNNKQTEKYNTREEAKENVLEVLPQTKKNEYNIKALDTDDREI